jgi:hypothetical protein
MKKSILSVLVLLFSVGALAAESQAHRNPASGQSCIRFPSFPTLECARGYVVEEVADHCWACVAYAPPVCIKAPTLTCASGYGLSRDQQGCFHCTTVVQSN